MTVMINEDPALPEALDEPTEMAMLHREVYDSMRTTQAYHAGNTTLLEALMLMMADAPEGDAKDAGREALQKAGMADESGALNWPALAARKAGPMTWEDAVRKFVKQPAEQARLLALGDKEAPNAGA